VAVWSPEGFASGGTTLDVRGDQRPPVVWEQDPRGEASGLFDAVSVTFSEPMLEPDLSVENFVILGPEPISVQDVVVTGAAREVTVRLSDPFDAGAGTWTLEISQEVRDSFGNRLAGDWVDEAPYAGMFGDVGGALDDVICEVLSPLSGRFRPDGDDGVAEEADQVEIGLSSPSTPAWWIASIEDSTGVLLDRRWQSPLGAEDVFVWDGRDSTGAIVLNGTYEVLVQAGDGAGNRSDGCLVTPIVVDNRGSL
jgi:hypothetical protein